MACGLLSEFLSYGRSQSVSPFFDLPRVFFEKKEDVISSKVENSSSMIVSTYRRNMISHLAESASNDCSSRSLITTLHLPDNIKLDLFMSAYILDVSKAGRTKELDLLDSASSDSGAPEEEMSDESR